MKEEKVKQHIDSNKGSFSYFYSPPYLEEVANIGIEKTELINQHIAMIDSLFTFKTFRPVVDGDIVEYYESAKKVYNRVIKDIHLSQLAEEYETLLFSIFKSEQELNNFKNHVISNIPNDKIFSEENIKKYICYINEKRPSSCPEIYTEASKNKKYLKNHRQTEALINVLFNILEVAGYRAESHKPQRIRSRMHDVSHAIYATKSDVFVIEDKKFREKCKAVYNILGVNTKVVSYEEFEEQNF